LQKLLTTIAVFVLSPRLIFSQLNSKDVIIYNRLFAGSRNFLLGILGAALPSFYQVKFGYRIAPKDVISIEAFIRKYDKPLHIFWNFFQ